MAGNFFSILKTGCIYRHKPAIFLEANEMIDRYIHFNSSFSNIGTDKTAGKQFSIFIKCG